MVGVYASVFDVATGKGSGIRRTSRRLKTQDEDPAYAGLKTKGLSEKMKDGSLKL